MGLIFSQNFKTTLQNKTLKSQGYVWIKRDFIPQSKMSKIVLLL